MKKIKYIIITLLLIVIILIVGGLIKYNIDLNTFKQEISDRPKSENKSKTNNGTEVHILGTVHFETNKIKRRDLYDLIDSISPSVILYEGDSARVKKILKNRDYFFQLLRVYQNRAEIEKIVTLTYIENNPNCVVLPYEWELRDQYHHKHKILSKPGKMISSVIELHNQSLLTNEQSVSLKKLIALSNQLNKIGEDGTLTDINSLTTDSIAKQRQDYFYKKASEIVKDRDELSMYLDFLPIHKSYWDIRNKAMVQNILKQIKFNPNKVIVVLNGFYHRYYLIDELKKYETEFDFTIKGI